MLVANLGVGSNAAGEFHYPIEVTFESRKGQTGFYIGFYFPERYHKTVLDLGPFGSLAAAIETIRLAAGAQYAPFMGAIYASYGVTSAKEVFRDVYGPIRAKAAQWQIHGEPSLIARFEAEVRESLAETAK